MPVGSESNFSGVVDLLEMKQYKFEGKLGENVETVEIQPDLKSEVENANAKLIERLVEFDDSLTEKYLAGEKIDITLLKKAIRKAVIENKLVPVFLGSALKNKGVQLVLDAVVDYLPSPLDVPPIKGEDINTGDPIERKSDDSQPFSALVFKLQTDAFVGQLSFFRVYSGKVSAGDTVLNSSTGKKERIGRIVRLHANSREEVKEVYAGEIAAGVGLKDTKTSHTLCDPNNPILLESINFPEPVVMLRIEPKTKADQEKNGHRTWKTFR